jgi:mRNA-degrading endonuclease RelE of RelBE toxin-antitoxin system
MLDIAEELKAKLSREEYVSHPTVKLLARLLNATLEIIPQDPNNRDYLLKGNLSKFRRYKTGLKRYRILFCFSNTPPLIIYLYVNDTDHLRKDGDKNDPYREFEMLVKKGVFSHNPDDVKMRQWIRKTV